MFAQRRSYLGFITPACPGAVESRRGADEKNISEGLVHTLIKVGIPPAPPASPHINSFRWSAEWDSGSLCRAARWSEWGGGIPPKQRLTPGILSGPLGIVLPLDETMPTGGGLIFFDYEHSCRPRWSVCCKHAPQRLQNADKRPRFSFRKHPADIAASSNPTPRIFVFSVGVLTAHTRNKVDYLSNTQRMDLLSVCNWRSEGDEEGEERERERNGWRVKGREDFFKQQTSQSFMPCFESKVSRGRWEFTQWNRVGERGRSEEREQKQQQTDSEGETDRAGQTALLLWRGGGKESHCEDQMTANTEGEWESGGRRKGGHAKEAQLDSEPELRNVRVCRRVGSGYRCSSAWCVQGTRPGGEEGAGGGAARGEVAFRGRRWGRSPSSAVTAHLQPERRGICLSGGPVTGTSPPRNLSHLSTAWFQFPV